MKTEEKSLCIPFYCFSTISHDRRVIVQVNNWTLCASLMSVQNKFSTLCCWCDNRGQKLLHIIDRLSRFMHLKSNLIMWKNKINNRNRKFLAGWWTLTVSDDTNDNILHFILTSTYVVK